VKSENKKWGGTGELIACRFLEQKGFRIIETGYRKPWGEVDIIAKKEGVIHFVEVKSVTREPDSAFSREMMDPEEKVDPRKVEKIRKAGEFYLREKYPNSEAQVDVIAVFLNTEQKRAQCRFTENVL